MYAYAMYSLMSKSFSIEEYKTQDYFNEVFSMHHGFDFDDEFIALLRLEIKEMMGKMTSAFYNQRETHFCSYVESLSLSLCPTIEEIVK